MYGKWKLVLAVTIISLLLYMIYFPTDVGISGRFNQRELLGKLEKSTCPKGNIITVGVGGRLGNKIWEYMSLYAAYHLYETDYNLEAFVPKIIREEVETVFNNLSIADIENISKNCQIENRTKLIIGNNDDFVNKNDLPHKQKVIIELYKWSARYEFIIPFGIENMKKELRFRSELIEESWKLFDSLKKKFYNETDNVIFVGMHYRGTDYSNYLKKNLGNKFTELPSYKFYNKAMTYFQERYSKIIFVLITIDELWLKRNRAKFKKDINLVINPERKINNVNDLAVLAHCNHSVISYGTFSTTAALYAGGETIVYDIGIPLDFKGPTLTLGLVKNLPNWHKITN